MPHVSVTNVHMARRLHLWNCLAGCQPRRLKDLPRPTQLIDLEMIKQRVAGHEPGLARCPQAAVVSGWRIQDSTVTVMALYT